MARSKIKSTKADLDVSVRTGMTIEIAAQRRVLTENLIKLMPKGEYGSYNLNLLKALHIQHIGPLPWDDNDVVEVEVQKEIPEVIVE